jgi:hypothetical protein
MGQSHQIFSAFFGMDGYIYARRRTAAVLLFYDNIKHFDAVNAKNTLINIVNQ